ncbi:hypothetical protein D9M71_744100 [compost metagenome]
MIAQVFRILPYVAQTDQLGEQAMSRAFGDIQLLGQSLHWQPLRLPRQTFQHAEDTLDLTASHGMFQRKFE